MLIQVVNHHIPLSAHTLMSALLSPVPRVQSSFLSTVSNIAFITFLLFGSVNVLMRMYSVVAGLNLWGKVFSGGGVASPFIIQGVGQQPLRQLRTLTFLIMNCSANVCESN